MLSQRTTKLLEASGWYQDRVVPIEEHLSTLYKEGYETNDLVVQFLRNFCDLDVQAPPQDQGSSYVDFQINPKIASQGISIDTIREYEQRVNETLVVIGEAYHTHMVLVLSFTGRFFAGYDDFLLQLGNSVAEGLNTLCEGTEGVKIG